MMRCGSWLHLQLQKPSRILVVDFLQEFIRQSYSINPPAALRRYWGRRVVEILVLRLQEAKVNLIKLIYEHLLRRIRSIRHGVCAKNDSILIFFEKLP